MKMSTIKSAIAMVIGLSSGAMAHGAERTVTLDVEGMTCVTCPYMVEQSLEQVDGVVDASASMESSTAEVTFDDDRADIEALTSATTNAGFPSSVRE